MGKVAKDEERQQAGDYVLRLVYMFVYICYMTKMLKEEMT